MGLEPINERSTIELTARVKSILSQKYTKSINSPFHQLSKFFPYFKFKHVQCVPESPVPQMITMRILFIRIVFVKYLISMKRPSALLI